jgi:hypothetical protein
MNEKVFLVSIFMFTSSLTHADAVQNKINQLFEQGYTHLEVERGTVKSKIVAYDGSIRNSVYGFWPMRLKRVIC